MATYDNKPLDGLGLAHLWDKIKSLVSSHTATVTQTLTSGTEIGSVDGTKLYAPAGGSGGGNVVGIGSRDNESHALYATAGNGIAIDNSPQAQTNVVIRNTPATETALGGVIIGDGLSVTAAGKISVTGGGGQSTWYGTSNTATGTAAKVVNCTGFTLATGAIIGVLFTTANTAATPTLNVNSTGAKTIYIGGSTINATTNVLKWSANTMLFFIYDGTYYRYLGSMAGATLNQPDGAGTWYGTSSTGATTAAKTTTITNFRLTPGAIVAVTFSNANTYVTNALTLNVNSTGAKTIYVNNAATSSSNTLTWSAKETLLFVYSGSYWYFITKSGGTGGGSYTLHPATASTLGGIKVGSGLSITSDGTLSATGGSGGSGIWNTYAGQPTGVEAYSDGHMLIIFGALDSTWQGTIVIGGMYDVYNSIDLVCPGIIMAQAQCTDTNASVTGLMQVMPNSSQGVIAINDVSLNSAMLSYAANVDHDAFANFTVFILAALPIITT